MANHYVWYLKHSYQGILVSFLINVDPSTISQNYCCHLAFKKISITLTYLISCFFLKKIVLIGLLVWTHVTLKRSHTRLDDISIYIGSVENMFDVTQYKTIKTEK